MFQLYFLFLCREKRQKIEDIKKNIRDAILVRIFFGYFSNSLDFSIVLSCLGQFSSRNLIGFVLHKREKETGNNKRR